MVQGKKLDIAIETAICAEYVSGATYKEISECYSISQGTISNLVKRHNIKRRADSLLLSEIILKLYQQDNLTISDIAEQLKVSRSFVGRNLKMQGVITLHGSIKRRRLQDNPFENITDSEVQYWLGWLASDGNVSSRDSKVYIGVKEEDAYILESFADFLGSGHKVCIRSNSKSTFQNGTNQSQAIVEFYSSDIKDFLIKLGITPRKSKTLSLTIPLTWNFIRGYFDGDGWVSVYKAKNRPNTTRCTLGLCTASTRFKDQLCDFLTAYNIVFKICQRGSMWEIRVTRLKDITYCYDYLYPKGISPYLKRKFQTLKQFLKR